MSIPKSSSVLDDQSLESLSLWYSYKTSVWPTETTETTVVHNIMRMLRSIHNVNRLAYISVPITSGRFLYELQQRQPAMEKAERMKLVIDYNYRLGHGLVTQVAKRRGCAVIYPADLIPVHQKWEQRHFQALWLSIIAEMSTELHLSDGWEYSNGGVEEFTHVMQLRLGLPRHPDLLFFNSKGNEKNERERMRTIEVFDHHGRTISLEDGLQAIDQSISWLTDNGFLSEKLNKCAWLLRQTQMMLEKGFYQ